MQIARAIIDDGDAHRGAPGSGNNPITPDGAGAALGGTKADGGGFGEAERRAGTRRIQASKKRRSASSTSSPVTTPTLRQCRRASLNRRNVPASRPTRSEINKPTATSANIGAPSARKPASSAADTTR